MAHHKTVSKARWMLALRRVAHNWMQEGALEKERLRIRDCYLPLLTEYIPAISEGTRILELCSGPVCAAQLIDGGEKTYLDPLLDEYRRMYPGKLPKGTMRAISGEKVPEDDASFDIILCLNGLDQALNPELMLNEIERLLKPSGTLLIGMAVLPTPLVRLRYMCERFCSPLRDDAHPYSYTLAALQRSLARHFDIVEESRVKEICSMEDRWLAEEYAFLCRRLDYAPADEQQLPQHAENQSPSTSPAT